MVLNVEDGRRVKALFRQEETELVNICEIKLYQIMSLLVIFKCLLTSYLSLVN